MKSPCPKDEALSARTGVLRRRGRDAEGKHRPRRPLPSGRADGDRPSRPALREGEPGLGWWPRVPVLVHRVPFSLLPVQPRLPAPRPPPSERKPEPTALQHQARCMAVAGAALPCTREGDVTFSKGRIKRLWLWRSLPRRWGSQGSGLLSEKKPLQARPRRLGQTPVSGGRGPSCVLCSLIEKSISQAVPEPQRTCTSLPGFSFSPHPRICSY